MQSVKSISLLGIKKDLTATMKLALDPTVMCPEEDLLICN